MIVLVGAAANSAILLLDYTNLPWREQNYGLGEVPTAGPLLLRPILMTTITTVLGPQRATERRQAGQLQPVGSTDG